MTEGSPPTNFIFSFQSAAGKQKSSCASTLHVVSSTAACQSFLFTQVHNKLYKFGNLRKVLYVLILFLHIHENLTGTWFMCFNCCLEVISFVMHESSTHLQKLSFSGVSSVMIVSEQCLPGWIQPPSN